MVSGCAKDDGAQKYDATCCVYLTNMPQEFDLLPATLRGNIEINVILNNISTGRKYMFRLSEQNGFRHDMALLPGMYSIITYTSHHALNLISVENTHELLTIEAHSQTPLPVTITNASDFAGTVKDNQPGEEILNNDTFSRNVQLDGQVVNIREIQDLLLFGDTTHVTIRPRETKLLQSTSHPNVTLIMQNQTQEGLPIEQATLIGVRFSSINAVFPKGVSVGMSLPDIAHSDYGAFGTPSYCLGTPFIGIGYDSSTLVYLDSLSGDRISITIDADNSVARNITYEFERYE